MVRFEVLAAVKLCPSFRFCSIKIVKYNIYIVGFEVLTAVSTKMAVFWFG
jgi:hypothetical protein